MDSNSAGTGQNSAPFQFEVDERAFRKSSWSKNNPKTCVEVAQVEAGVAIRDSKNPTGGTLYFTHDEWAAFVKGAQNGEFGS